MSKTTAKPRKHFQSANPGIARIPEEISDSVRIIGDKTTWLSRIGPISPEALYRHFDARFGGGLTDLSIFLYPHNAEMIVKNCGPDHKLSALLAKEGKMLRVGLLKVDGTQYSGKGKAFLQTLPSLCQTLSVSKIETEAGLDDGPYFWARHGFEVTPETNLIPFAKNIFLNHKACQFHLSDEVNAAIEKELLHFSADTPGNLARLPYTLDGRPIGAVLLSLEDNLPMILDLNNGEQKRRFTEAINRRSGSPAEITLSLNAGLN